MFVSCDDEHRYKGELKQPSYILSSEFEYDGNYLIFY